MSFDVEGLKLKIEDLHILKSFDNYGTSILTRKWIAENYNQKLHMS